MWSADGKELYYYQFTKGKLVAVPILQTRPLFSVGEPVTLPIDGIFQTVGQNQYDAASDKRFLVVLQEDRSQTQSRPTQQIHFVMNWFEELKRRVPIR